MTNASKRDEANEAPTDEGEDEVKMQFRCPPRIRDRLEKEALENGFRSAGAYQRHFWVNRFKEQPKASG